MLWGLADDCEVCRIFDGLDNVVRVSGAAVASTGLDGAEMLDASKSIDEKGSTSDHVEESSKV